MQHTIDACARAIGYCTVLCYSRNACIAHGIASFDNSSGQALRAWHACIFATVVVHVQSNDSNRSPCDMYIFPPALRCYALCSAGGVGGVGICICSPGRVQLNEQLKHFHGTGT